MVDGGLIRALSLRGDVEPFHVMELMREANRLEASGRRILHMEIGQPGTKAPRLALEAAREALERDRIGYTDALGLGALREGIARLYADWYGLDVGPERIVVTTGSSAGFLLSFLALFDQGARVALTSPGYPCYRQIVAALGLEPVLLSIGPQERWVPSPDMLAREADRRGLAGLLVASPANPTGTMLRPDELKALVGCCEERSIDYISDEIYHGLTYDAPASSALAFSDRVVVVNSFSKYFSMTGWRLGWLVVPRQAVGRFERLQQHFFISPPTISQFAALGALSARDELEANRALYAGNRALLTAALAEAGLSGIAPADGAFYLYADTSEVDDDSDRFARRLLHEAGIAITPGVDFDAARGRSFVRFSYAGSRDAVTEGSERLVTFLKRY
ncbi:MAG: aminotransferase class I/II-fold pyridoxal phosphate-dependent enzyme [Rhizobiales bacterium]|nr:aminotransferase class I/II-fold pyridoxal phosphate-dependent enzyme [Hyphomicrobiales bacterium]